MGTCRHLTCTEKRKKSVLQSSLEHKLVEGRKPAGIHVKLPSRSITQTPPIHPLLPSSDFSKAEPFLLIHDPKARLWAEMLTGNQ